MNFLGSKTMNNDQLQQPPPIVMGELCDFWFSHPDMWFHSTPENDTIITAKFGNLLLLSSTGGPDIKSIISHANKQELLGNIILYDQIIRHVFRGNSDLIGNLSNYALELSLWVLDNNWDTSFNAAERCFI